MLIPYGQPCVESSRTYRVFGPGSRHYRDYTARFVRDLRKMPEMAGVGLLGREVAFRRAANGTSQIYMFLDIVVGGTRRDTIFASAWGYLESPTDVQDCKWQIGLKTTADYILSKVKEETK